MCICAVPFYSFHMFYFCIMSFFLSSHLTQPDLLNFKKGWMTKLYEDGLVSLKEIITSALQDFISQTLLCHSSVKTLIVCFSLSLVLVEETLVCPDGSELEVLQRLDRRGGSYLKQSDMLTNFIRVIV